MSAPLVPSPLDYIGRRKFGFYPVINCAGPNLWILGSSSWSEVQFVNAESGLEIWVPRQYIGAVSDQHDTLIVGLNQSVELRGEQIVPHSEHRLVVMPKREHVANRQTNGPASVVSIRLESAHRQSMHNTPVRVGICVLFVIGLLVLVTTASR